MPLFTGRVGTLSHHYSLNNAAYHDPTHDTARELVFLTVSDLPQIQLAYDSRTPSKKCTLWDFATKIAASLVMPSLAKMKMKVGEALQKAVRYDQRFLEDLQATRGKIIIFENRHWFWGRYRPAGSMQWEGRNELGELLMLIRDNNAISIPLSPSDPANLIIPFPCSSTPETEAIPLPMIQLSPLRPAAATSSLDARLRPRHTSMDRIPSGPFSRLAPSQASLTNSTRSAYSPLFGVDYDDAGTPPLSDDAGSLPLMCISSLRRRNSDGPLPLFPPLPDVHQLTASLAPSYFSPARSSSTQFRSPPPAYSSNQASPIDASELTMPPLSALPRLDRLYRPMSDPVPYQTCRGAMASAGGSIRDTALPRRLRDVNVHHLSEEQELVRLQEEYKQRGRLLSDNIAQLRASNARRMRQAEYLHEQRKRREVERERIAQHLSYATAARRRIAASAPGPGLARTSKYGSLARTSSSSDRLRRADDLGERRAAELEMMILAKRRSFREAGRLRLERSIGEIERLHTSAAGGAASTGRQYDDWGLAPPTRSRRYSLPDI